MELDEVIGALKIERECITRNWHGKCDRKCDKCDLVQNTEYLLNVYSVAIRMLKDRAWHKLTEDADGIVHGLPGDDGQYLMTDGEDIWIDQYMDGVDDGVFLDSGRDIREVKAWMEKPELCGTDVI